MATLKQTLLFYCKVLGGVSASSYGYLYYRYLIFHINMTIGVKSWGKSALTQSWLMPRRTQQDHQMYIMDSIGGLDRIKL